MNNNVALESGNHGAEIDGLARRPSESAYDFSRFGLLLEIVPLTSLA